MLMFHLPIVRMKKFIYFCTNNLKQHIMKELIIQALSDAFVSLEKVIPQTKKKVESISIIDVTPMDLITFMKDNNIPENASFGGRDNGYDAWDDILLEWDVDVPTTDRDKLNFKRKNFTNYANQALYTLLLKNGYKRVGYSTSDLMKFDNTTVYDMYINKEFDRLEKYYSLPFVKV